MLLARRHILVATAIAAGPGMAMAADLPAEPPAVPPAAAPAIVPAPAPDWIVTVGIEGRVIPAWPGAPADKFGLTALPLFDFRKAGTPPTFFAPRDSLSFPVLDLGEFKFGPAVRLIWERRGSDYAALNGLGTVNFALQAGGFAEYWALPWLRLRGEVRQGIGGETGVTGDAFLDAVVSVDQFRLSGGPRLTLQSAKAVSPYFSITPEQSLGSTVAGLPALPVYNATGGLYSYGAGSQVEYFWGPQWAAHAFVEYERLTGSAANSPLVTQRGSPNQFTFGLGGTYSFTMRPFW